MFRHDRKPSASTSPKAHTDSRHVDVLSNIGTGALTSPLRERLKTMPVKNEMDESSKTTLQNFVSNPSEGKIFERQAIHHNSSEISKIKHFHPYAYPFDEVRKSHRCNLRSTAPVLYDLLCDESEFDKNEKFTSLSYSAKNSLESHSFDNFIPCSQLLTLPLISSPAVLPLLCPVDCLSSSYLNEILKKNVIMNSVPPLKIDAESAYQTCVEPNAHADLPKMVVQGDSKECNSNSIPDTPTTADRPHG